MTILTLSKLKFRVYKPFLSFVALMFTFLAFLEGVITAQQPIPKTVFASTPIVSTEERIETLEQQVKQLEDSPKDIWDKLNAVSGLISGGLVAAIGIVATYLYNERQRKNTEAQKLRQITILQVQTIQGFMPQLQSGDKDAVAAALSCIYTLDQELGKKLSDLYRGSGGADVLGKIERKEAREELLAFLRGERGNVEISDHLEDSSTQEQMKRLTREACDFSLGKLSPERLKELELSDKNIRYMFYTDVYLILHIWLRDSIKYGVPMQKTVRSIPENALYIEAINFIKNNRIEYFLLADRDKERVIEEYLDEMIQMIKNTN